MDLTDFCKLTASNITINKRQNTSSVIIEVYEPFDKIRHYFGGAYGCTEKYRTCCVIFNYCIVKVDTQCLKLKPVRNPVCCTVIQEGRCLLLPVIFSFSAL